MQPTLSLKYTLFAREDGVHKSMISNKTKLYCLSIFRCFVCMCTKGYINAILATKDDIFVCVKYEKIS